MENENTLRIDIDTGMQTRLIYLNRWIRRKVRRAGRDRLSRCGKSPGGAEAYREAETFRL